MRNLELPGRSPAHAINGMAATSHTLSTSTAIDILRRGGNAMDAAIAACAVQCVVEPESTGIGGDCFCMYAPGGKDKIVAFNGSGKAPKAATVDYYLGRGITSIERQTPDACVVPGAIDAWFQLNRDFGRLGLDELLKQAIDYARHGYPVSSRVSLDFQSQANIIANEENLKSVFMPSGQLPRVGEIHRQPALANTMEAIAHKGRDAFYLGEIAEDMVDYLRKLGGLHTLEDFANLKGDYVTPISTEFRGHTVWECPPNGQGVIALQLLNIIAGFNTQNVDPISVERLHQEIEAGRLAYNDRNTFLADPTQANVPVEDLLSQEHAKNLRSQINPEYRIEPLLRPSLPKHESTVYISVVDKDRNACSFINTLFHSFGSGLMAPKTGVVFTNRAQGFVIKPGHPNCIAPEKRPMTTIIPGMITKDGQAKMAFGVMGGHYQAFGHMHFLSRFFDFEHDIQEAQDAPRVFPVLGDDTVEMEDTVPSDVIQGLEKLGHKRVQPDKPIGGSQAIWIDTKNGVLTGGSEPRKDGCAIGF
ncbi:MAG: gamma-glutamyltransferase [Rhodospirillaceae bacterium TMED8]|nr:gamma-glutamyltransferase [Magnetovibrio sp.]OUT49029.1 MAG: gamma-glutamyltransferase [Rhodospirillaceae bacterium TMED8]